MVDALRSPVVEDGRLNRRREALNAPFPMMLIMMFAGWVNEHQRRVIAYLQEENRVLRELWAAPGN